MGELMSLEMAFCDKLLIALTAHKGSLTCMSSHVRLEIASLREFLQTLLKGAQEDLLLLFWSLYLLELA